MTSEETEKDSTLRNAFATLRGRGITSAWASSLRPYTDLLRECLGHMADPLLVSDLQHYLRAHAVIRHSVEMFCTYIALSARSKWDDVPDDIKPITARGWFLGRWLPTFLIIDGPIGRFVCGDTSPLHRKVGPSAPLLTAVRDFLNDRQFRLLRNGFAHWGFEWDVVGSESYVVAYDWERDLPTTKLHQLEADAFHIVAFALIEIIDGVFISQRKLPLSDA